MQSSSLFTPVGWLFIRENAGEIDRIGWCDAPKKTEAAEMQAPNALLQEAGRQITAYFDRKLEVFDLPLRVEGSVFQKNVCAAMLAIPFGETRTYGDLARELGAAAQPVGNACGANPLPVVIPCHRVLGATSLGGYSGAGGVETKVTLLRHEGAGGLLI